MFVRSRLQSGSETSIPASRIRSSSVIVMTFTS